MKSFDLMHRTRHCRYLNLYLIVHFIAFSVFTFILNYFDLMHRTQYYLNLNLCLIFHFINFINFFIF